MGIKLLENLLAVHYSSKLVGHFHVSQRAATMQRLIVLVATCFLIAAGCKPQAPAVDPIEQLVADQLQLQQLKRDRDAIPTSFMPSVDMPDDARAKLQAPYREKRRHLNNEIAEIEARLKYRTGAD